MKALSLRTKIAADGCLGVGLGLIVVAGVGAWFFFLRPVKPDFDQGGTILVYEIAGHFANPERTEATARALQQRLDLGDRGIALVRPLPWNGVEIRVPRTDENHAAVVAEVKDLVAAAGLLEFQILANSVDDLQAIKDVQEMFNVRAASDPVLQQELADLRRIGLPPPGPRVPGGKERKFYQITLAKNEKSLVWYLWAELGPQERRALNLDNAAEFDPKRNQLWLEANKFRGKAARLKDPATGRFLLQGALFYSRKSQDRDMPDKERQEKALDYFVLCRNLEIDPRRQEIQDWTNILRAGLFPSLKPWSVTETEVPPQQEK
jgi:hypothetical protein